MKRQVSVSIFLAILVIALAWLYIKFSNETRPKEKENEITTENDVSSEQSVTISQEYISYPYCIKAQDGKVAVFKTQENDIYMETSIEIEILPLDIQEKIKKGIYFKTEGELYDFLESYSS